jgi:hypothetical protein
LHTSIFSGSIFTLIDNKEKIKTEHESGFKYLERNGLFALPGRKPNRRSVEIAVIAEMALSK